MTMMTVKTDQHQSVSTAPASCSSEISKEMRPLPDDSLSNVGSGDGVVNGDKKQTSNSVEVRSRNDRINDDDVDSELAKARLALQRRRRSGQDFRSRRKTMRKEKQDTGSDTATTSTTTTATKERTSMNGMRHRRILLVHHPCRRHLHPLLFHPIRKCMHHQRLWQLVQLPQQ
jgi:hypothetical protein